MVLSLNPFFSLLQTKDGENGMAQDIPLIHAMA